MLHNMWQNAVVAAPDFAVCYDNFLGQLSSPKANFFDDLLAIGADGLGTVEDGIQFQL